jgi:hypothetical protein
MTQGERRCDNSLLSDYQIIETDKTNARLEYEIENPGLTTFQVSPLVRAVPVLTSESNGSMVAQVSYHRGLVEFTQVQPEGGPRTVTITWVIRLKPLWGWSYVVLPVTKYIIRQYVDRYAAYIGNILLEQTSEMKG